MKIFEASVKGGQVIADGGIILSCPILGDGGDSTGYLIMAEGKLVYIPNKTPDLSKTLDLLIDLANKLGSQIYPANMGGDITDPAFAGNMQAISDKLTEIKGALK